MYLLVAIPVTWCRSAFFDKAADLPPMFESALAAFAYNITFD